MRFSWQICCGDKAGPRWLGRRDGSLGELLYYYCCTHHLNDGCLSMVEDRAASRITSMIPYYNMLDRQKSSRPCMARCNYSTIQLAPKKASRCEEAATGKGKGGHSGALQMIGTSVVVRGPPLVHCCSFCHLLRPAIGTALNGCLLLSMERG